jgi:Rrf2 family protein
VLVLLAMQPPGRYVAAGDLADALGLPRRFAEQQVSALARAGIVRCRRGATGGCALALPSEQISVRDVMVALEGEVLDVPRQADSATSEAWRQASETLSDRLGDISLDELAKRQCELDAASAVMYYI